MKKGMSASDLLRSLREDAGFTQAEARASLERARRRRELGALEEPLVVDLRNVGINVESVWDLVNSAEDYSPAIPILVRHLRMDYPTVIREGIARALAVPAARRFQADLVDELMQSKSGSELQWALACAIAGSADEGSSTVLQGLARSAVLGWSRAAFLPYLLRSKDKESADILRDLETQPAFDSEIRRLKRALGKD